MESNLEQNENISPEPIQNAPVELNQSFPNENNQEKLPEKSDKNPPENNQSFSNDKNQPEAQQNDPHINQTNTRESKETIKLVFDSFDKDKSGYIEIKEIVLMSKELGEEVKAEDLNTIFKDLDNNKDGKISFAEFWDWWIYGRASKLEKLVFLKLKAMNLIKKAHSNFVRFGANLDDKYDNVLDHHYLALNLGETINETSLSFKLFIHSEEMKPLFDEYRWGTSLNENFSGLIFNFESNNAEQTLSDLKHGIDKLEELNLPEELKTLLGLIKFHFSRKINTVIVMIEFQHAFFLDMVENLKTGFLEKVGKDFQCTLNINLGIKNSFQKLIQNLQKKFVTFFFEGFLAETKLTINTSFLKNIRNAFFKWLLTKKEKESGFNLGIMLSLLSGSKAHFVFRDIEDVDNFFKGMGVHSLLEEQPSVQELLDEIKGDLFTAIPLFKDETFGKFILFCQKYVIAKFNIALKIPDFMATLNGSFKGFNELVNYLWN